MRVGQVADVDVVADAGAVGRRVVGAEDLDMRRPEAACKAIGIRCVSGAWSSPIGTSDGRRRR